MISTHGSLMRPAVQTILSELKRHFRDKDGGGRVPRSMQERFLQVNDAVAVLSGEHSDLGRSHGSYRPGSDSR